MTILKQQTPDGRILVTYSTPTAHVLGFTTTRSDVARFHELRLMAGPAPDEGKLMRLLDKWVEPVQGASGVETTLLKALPVADMLDTLATGDPAWPDVDLTGLAGEHERFGFRRQRDFHSHVRQAQLAIYYGDLVRAKVRNPLRRIADERFGGHKPTAGNNLALARANNYLTSAGAGIPGGRATDKAHDLLGRVRGAAHTQNGATDAN